jgi:NAD+ synthase
LDISAKLTLNSEVTRHVLVAFLRAEIKRFGFQKAVLGLSGGVDSALSCFLAAEALGPESVLALLMPYRTSAAESTEHALQVTKITGVATQSVDITSMVEPYLAQHPQMSDVRRGNVMARTRMIVLYDHSSQWNGLAVGTSNKTELLLGYGTLFGDMASAVNPLGDLYKTQVRQMARAVGVPEAIVRKAPSADLWAGQTDEGELGFTYADVDKLLYCLVDERYSPEEAIADGFDPQFVAVVTRKLRQAQFKRVPPIIAKVSRRDVGHDFLYPRDWGT